MVQKVGIKVSDYSHFAKINENHLETVDFKKPGIIAESSPENYNLIDGNHRIKKAEPLDIKLVAV